jgi:hypothetical protein
LTAVINQTTAGSTFSGPLIRLKTAAAAIAATLTMSATPFGAVAAGSATANAITPDTSAAGNASNVTNGVITDRNGTDCILFAVATSGSDLNLNAVLINTGVQVSITSLVMNAMP